MSNDAVVPYICLQVKIAQEAFDLPSPGTCSDEKGQVREASRIPLLVTQCAASCAVSNQFDPTLVLVPDQNL